MSASNFLTDYLDLEPFAAEVDRDPRTVRRWLNEPDGLPFTRIGNRILIHIPTAREWLFSRMQRPNPRPTTKGHPRKAERAGVAARRAMTAIMKPAAIGARPASVFVNWQVGGSEDRPSQVLQQAIRAELAGSDSCSALGITISSSSPVLALCRKLVQAGFDPSTPLEVRSRRDLKPAGAQYRRRRQTRSQRQG